MNENILVWDCIFYTQDEDGNITKYRTNDDFDHSYIAESVEMSDLVEIEEE